MHVNVSANGRWRSTAIFHFPLSLRGAALPGVRGTAGLGVSSGEARSVGQAFNQVNAKPAMVMPPLDLWCPVVSHS